MDVPAVRSYALPTDREPEAHTTSAVPSSRLEGPKKVPLLLRGKPATFVLDLDQDSAVASSHAEADVALAPTELECILQEIRRSCSEDLPVDFDRRSLVDGTDGQVNPMSLRFHGGRDFDVFDEFGQRHPCAPLDSGFETDLRECVIDESAHGHETATEDLARSAEAGGAPLLQHLIREQCRRDEVAQFVGEKAQALAFLIEAGLLALASVLGDRSGGRCIETSVQGLKLFSADWRVRFDGQLCDRLKHVAIAVNDLCDPEADAQQVGAIPGCGLTDVRSGTFGVHLVRPQSFDDLVEEGRDTAVHLLS